MQHTSIQRSTLTHSRGFTLLEALIALVILSIGLLGIAALQGLGLRSTHGAYLTSQAGFLAYDIADRIRANPGIVPSAGSISTVVGDCAINTTELALTAADRAEWSCAVQTLLPNGSGTVTHVDSTSIPGASTYTITLAWQDLQTADPWTYELVIEI